jgi:hypothetical protein
MPFDTKTWDAWYSGNFTPDRGQRDDDTHRYFYDEKSLDDFIQKENRKNGFVPDGTGYVLRGYTYKKSWNASANAKFKVGDRVKAKDPRWVGYQGHALGTDVYTVNKVDWDGTVKLDGFLDLWISPDSLVAANSRSRNAVRSRNAIKIGAYGLPEVNPGDKVRVVAPGFPMTGKVLTVESVSNGTGGNIKAGGFSYRPHDLEIVKSVRSRNSVRSTNAVVQEALNAALRPGAFNSAARNAVKPGDMVKVEWEYDADKKGLVGMTGEVLKISSGIATVAIREKGNREYIVAGHALRKIANTARNDMTRHPYTSTGKRFMEKARASIRKASEKDLGPGGMWLPKMLSEMERTPGLSDDEMDLIQDDMYRLINEEFNRRSRLKAKNSAARNADDPGHFTSAELSALKGAFAGLKGAKFSQYPNKSWDQLSVRGDGYIQFDVRKYAEEGDSIQFSIRGQGPRTAFKAKFVSSIRDAVAAMKRMMAAAKKQSPYAFGTSDFYD